MTQRSHLLADWDFFSSVKFNITDENKERASEFGYAFFKVVKLISAVNRMADKKLADFETVEAETYKDLSQRLQLALGTCLDYFGSDVTCMIFGAPIGSDNSSQDDGALGLSLCCIEGMRTLLSQPAVHAAIERVWKGTLLDETSLLLNSNALFSAKLLAIAQVRAAPLPHLPMHAVPWLTSLLPGRLPHRR